MTPLSDALTAAQRRALAALQKAYVAEAISPDELREKLHGCGISDDVDVSYLTHTLNVLREWGAAVPAETNGKQDDVAATDAQWARIRRDCERANLAAPVGPLTKSDASRIIQELERGEYEPVPF